MLRIMFMVALVAGLSGLWLSAVQAGGGVASLGGGAGGCREPHTEGSGTTVEIVDFCFLSTVLYVETGSVVQWTNLDAVQHNIVGVGADWSDGRLFAEGQTTSAGFNQAGIFPYFCQIHPGMVGVVVVGSGAEAVASLALPRDADGKNSWVTHGVAILAGSGLSIAAVAGFGARVRRQR